jgi:hypothetical protein
MLFTVRWMLFTVRLMSKDDLSRAVGAGLRTGLIEVKRVKLSVGLMLPVLRKAQQCEACGESFTCEISLGKGCWCGKSN